MAEKTTGNLILWFFLGCLLVSTLMLGWLFWPFVSIIVLGAVITGIFSPIYTFMQRSGKIRASLASLVVCGLIFFILFIPTIFFVGILSSEAYDLYQAARNAVISERFQSLIEGSMILEKANAILVYFNIELTGQELNKGISEIGKYVGFFLYDQARAIASNMLAFIVNFFLMLIVIYYLLIDGGRLISFIVDLSPLPGDHSAHYRHRSDSHPYGHLSILDGPSGCRHIYDYFLCRAVRRHRIHFQTQTGGASCENAHPAGIFFHHRGAEAFRYSGHHIWTVGDHGLFNPDRHI